ncbi:hypothetical protein GCM10010260_48430 [Streptomyces filipinensis]|uniref:Uncharacterized protein n=1 Tax=Streptomyces filipinensis TaxID=66887 RepID=A0A918IDW4_9ACTN|nr:hypothetical protein [Streptomyces filipinensis]GGV05537.1 hypothetical protein GCM10010260_48430 [Streptomyces filipinensis]
MTSPADVAGAAEVAGAADVFGRARAADVADAAGTDDVACATDATNVVDTAGVADMADAAGVAGAAGAPVAEFATGLQTTRVHRTPEGRYTWWHGPGPLRPDPLAAPLAAYVPRHTPGARLAVPRPRAAGLAHLADGAHSAAAWLRDPRPQARTLVAHALAAAGRALRTLHTTPAPVAAATPPALARLRAYLTADPAAKPGGAAVHRLREDVVRAWGPARLERLRSWCHGLAEPCRDAVLVHGFASLGALVPPARPAPVALLTGEDLGAARPELDLGWLLGDLAELAWSAPAPAGSADLSGALLDGYGPDADRAWAARAAVVRIAAHQRDFAAYCGWSDELPAYTAFIADLIDEEGRRAVPGAPS